jgi:hypothetical protein
MDNQKERKADDFFSQPEKTKIKEKLKKKKRVEKKKNGKKHVNLRLSLTCFSQKVNKHANKLN